MEIDLEHLERILPRYLKAGPRYTSYPTAPAWSDTFGPTALRNALREARRRSTPLSLYVHVPFCRSLCHFCACNRVITRSPDLPRRYLEVLEREVDAVAALLGDARPVSQIHWGGGTPTHLDEDQIERLGALIARRFGVAPGAELSVEVDPRVTRPTQVAALRACGFDRMSLGVQDFDPRVQRAIHRDQPVEVVAALVEHARGAGFAGLAFDLIYGLPFQTLESFERTLDRVIELAPDRIALYAYAHVTWVAKQQRGFERGDLPDAPTRLRLFVRALSRLLGAGYVHVGMDHFARPEDPLVRALEDGSLRRNFMGYTTQADTELVGFGPSAISELAAAYAQSHRELDAWQASVDACGLATLRGHRLDADDRLRRHVIQQIMCAGTVHAERFEAEQGRPFAEYFERELAALRPLQDDGLVELDTAGGLALTPSGRLLVRNVAMVFDAYLARQLEAGRPLFSRTA